jgi:hypothetical protein
LNQTWRQFEHTGWFHPKVLNQTCSCLVQNVWMESPCIINLSVLHVWFKTWMESPCMFNLSSSTLSEHTGWFYPKVWN